MIKRIIWLIVFSASLTCLLFLVSNVDAATHDVVILGWSTNSNNSDVFPEPLSIKGANDNFNPMVWIFNDGSTRNLLEFKFTVPQNYVDTAQFVIVWFTDATSTNDVAWDIDYRATGVGESADQSSDQENIASLDTASGTAFLWQRLVITATDGNFAAGDIVSGQIIRDLTDANDDIVNEVILYELYFEYNDV